MTHYYSGFQPDRHIILVIFNTLVEPFFVPLPEVVVHFLIKKTLPSFAHPTKRKRSKLEENQRKHVSRLALQFKIPLDSHSHSCINCPMLISSTKTFISISLFAIHSILPTSVPAWPETAYQHKWCDSVGGKSEVTLPDRTRCDCLTETHAVEVEFARKWKEAIGQTLWYAAQTGKRPGVVLIMKNDGSDDKYWVKLNSLVNAYSLDITLWRIITDE